MLLYNRTWTRRELEARVGRLEQIAGIRRFTLAEGGEAGVEQIQVRTGAGLAYYVSPQRGLDISLAEFGGVPLSWQSPNGDAHPAYYDDRGLAWLRSAAGGLLMTCGFTQAGAPNTDAGQELGLHGRAHHLPAREVAATGTWDGDDYTMRVQGMVEETVIFGEFVRLTRAIHSALGSNRLAITDRFENLGFAPAPLMLLYHFNFGFPLLSEATTVTFPSQQVIARDEGTPLAGYQGWQPPEPGHQERVYLHSDLKTDTAGWAAASIHNPAFPLSGGPIPLTVQLRWNTATLPTHVQWRMAGAGTHVLGIEPTNTNVRGRAAARADGSLVWLAPGASTTCELELDVTTSRP
jgi:hypothetical protein